MPNDQKPFSESGTSPPFVNAEVLKVQFTSGSPTAAVEAVDAVGRVFLFSGDLRPMVAIAGALDAGWRVEVFLQKDQIIAWRAGR